MYFESSLNPTHHALQTAAQQQSGFEASSCELHTTQCSLPIPAVFRNPSAPEDTHARPFRTKDAVCKLHAECLIVVSVNALRIDLEYIILRRRMDDSMPHQHNLPLSRIRIAQTPTLPDQLLKKFIDTLSDARILPPLAKSDHILLH